MSKISFEDIGSVVATFLADSGVKGGQVVKLTGNGQVGPCSAGDAFCGVSLEPRAGLAAVQVKGFVTVKTADTLTVGWAELAGDGDGGVKTAETGGVAALVADVKDDGTAVICLCSGKERKRMAISYDNLKLDKGMYQEAGRSFSQVLERQDPSEQYKGTSLEGLDAFQRQLKRFDIKVKGAGSDVVEKFFRTADSAVLFPEYIARSVRQGMEEGDILPHITAAVTRFDGMDYRSITAEAGGDSKQLRHVEEGAAIPATTIQVQSNLVKLHKRGRMLVASYEAVRYQKLDLFSVTLRQIGAHIARAQLEDAVDVLKNGDGNGNAASVFTTAAQGELTYDDLVDFWAKFDPYEMNALLVSGDVMVKLLKLSEFQNPLTGLNFQGTGKLTTPLGANLLRTSVLPAGTAIGLDKRFALEMVQGSDVTVEYDKLIDRQLERAAVTTISGFAKVFKDASRVLEVKK